MGRPPALPILERVIARYQTIGGGSPLPKTVRAQAAAMQAMLAADGCDIPVMAAFRYAEPSIGDVVRELVAKGFRRIVGVSDSPHFSRVTTGAYFDDLEAAGTALGIETLRTPSYCDHPSFLAGLAECALRARAKLPEPDNAFLIFSAHSLPLEHVAGGDPYVDELRRTVVGVLARLPHHDWQVAYQSKGMGQGEWLEPPVEAVLEKVAAEGRRQVLLSPAGFTADHVETLYDIDVLIAGRARELGLTFSRADALNTSPALIRTLCETARSGL